MNTLFVNNNGVILKNEGFTIETGNRGYLYGDGLFESIRIINGKPINLKVHIIRLIESMAVLKMRIPVFFTADFFYNRITELTKQSYIENGGRVRLSVDRMGHGTHFPETNEVCYFIEVYPMEDNLFTLNKKGWEVELFTTIHKEKNVLSNFKTKNRLINILASIEAREKKVDDLLLTSTKGCILEGTSSNLFVVSNGILYTPGLEEGCVGGTMRMTIINLALENNIRVYESSIIPQNLLMADEVFLTNAICGIIWVVGFRTKRYMKDTSQKFTDLLNKHLLI